MSIHRNRFTTIEASKGKTEDHIFNLVQAHSHQRLLLRPRRHQSKTSPLERSKRWQCLAHSPQEVYVVSDAVAVVKNVASLATGVGILAALGWSAIPVIPSPKGNDPSSKAVSEEDAEGVKWGLMSVISCLPIFNWLAWIFAGFEDEERATFYYALATLYAIPQVSAGFQPNWFSIATLIAGVAHVQVERIADERGVAHKFNFQLQGDLGDKPAQASKMIGDSARSFAEAIQSSNQQGGKDAAAVAEEEDDGIMDELQQWDQRFQAGSDKRKKR